MTSVPRFALYGTDSAPAWADLVHHERIPSRSSRYNWEIDPHVHEGLLQVLYIVTGSGGEALIDGRRWPLRPPCLVLVPSGAVHGFHFRNDIDGPVITAAQRPLESLMAAIAPELLPHIRTPKVLPVDPDGPFIESLMPLFDGIERETRYAAPGQVVAGMALLAALFVQVARLSDSAAATPGDDPRSRKAGQIEQFRNLVNERFRQHRGVAHYAQHLGLTAGHLGRLCREALGMSPLDVINARIVHEAQRELVYSLLSVKQVAAELGYDDEAYFGRFFKKHTGQRPTEFREMARRQMASG